MANAIIDNSENFKLVEFVKKLLADQRCTHIMIATGYWDLPGTRLLYAELQDFFARGGKFQLLIGQEPTLQYRQVDHDVHQFPDFYMQRDINALTEQYKDVARLIIDNACIDSNPEGNFEIRVYGQGEHKEFLHAKCYIFLGAGLGTGIVGSSNFTQKGLEDNAELNYLEENGNTVAAETTQYSNSKSHKAWFEEKWTCSEPWTGKFISQILTPSSIGRQAMTEKADEEQSKNKLTPYEVYIKYLQMQFGDMIDTDTSALLKNYLPEKFNPLEYQLDAVKQCFSIMKRHGGFMLGDVVGLGKTIVAVLLVRHFIEHAAELGRSKQVLIVTPPAIRPSWSRTIDDFDKNSRNQIANHVTFVTTGSIGNLIDEDSEIDSDSIELRPDDNYGLIIIDESHNFRNRGTQKYIAIDELIGSTNPTPYIGLLSATPQNNTPADLYHQILLFQRQANNSTLPGIEGGKLDAFFNAQTKRFAEARNMPQDTDEQRAEARCIIQEVSEAVRNAVLNDLLVRRTRTDIKKMYGTDADVLKFPKVKGPHKLEYSMDSQLQQLFYDTVQAICPPDLNEIYNPDQHIGFYRYAAITQFKNDANKKLYEYRNLTVDSITRRLQNIMQILLVKRLESSLEAFKASLKNLGRYNDVMIDMLEHDCVFICPDIDVNKLHKEADDDFDKFKASVEAEISRKKGKNRRFAASDFNAEFYSNLKADKRLINKLLDRWYRNSEDPKFDRFKEAVKPELFNPAINNPSGQHAPRLVIFTEAIDTLEAISRYLTAKGFKVLTVSAKNRDEMQRRIEENFDANCPADRQRDDYNVIVTTEVLAEGVNLHRANVILNYDTPWNATRLMQRIGRVNRIGSIEDFVHVFNFFPSAEGNAQIRLIEKAYAKLQSFHEMFGEDNKVFSEREQLSERDLQKFTDGEESPFAQYITELQEYRQANPGRYGHIAGVEAADLGGRLSAGHAGTSVFVFADESQRYTSVAVDAANGTGQIISVLSTMEHLKCDKDAMFDQQSPDYATIVNIARNTLDSHTVHYTTSRDGGKKTNEALGRLKELEKIPNLNNESRAQLRQLSKLVRNKDSYAVKTVLKLKPEQNSLFGADGDINDLIHATFGNLTDRAQQKRGKQTIAIFEIQ